eukprot:s1804_g15.t1
MSESDRWAAWANDAVDQVAKEEITIKNKHAFHALEKLYNQTVQQRKDAMEIFSFIAAASERCIKSQTGLHTERQKLIVIDFDQPGLADPKHVLEKPINFSFQQHQAFPWGPIFLWRVCFWANKLRWNINRNECLADISFLELYIDFVLTTGSRTPRNVFTKAERDRYTAPHYVLDDVHVRADCQPPLRKHCSVVKFCSKGHLEKAEAPTPKKKAKGREALDVEQTAMLFKTLLGLGYVWAAVLMLFQLFLGERADAARQVKQGWLKHFDPKAADVPLVVIPNGVNAKTLPREVSLPASFAHAVHSWMQKPLTGGKGQQWPFPGQSLHIDSDVLFPGKNAEQNRGQKPISERAYFEALRKAGKALVRSREQARKKGEPHVYEGVNLTYLGTHSMKKTHVTLLKTHGFSTALISSISGTCPATLDKHYDVPTSKRQREALDTVFGPLLPGQCDSNGDSYKHAAIYCTSCGQPVQEEWRFCRNCGTSQS